MPDHLQQYLRGLNREGVVDSHGRFSIDPVRARQKMSRFRYPVPTHYILSLIRALVLSRPSGIDVVVDAGNVTLRFDGEEWADQQLELLYGALLEDHPGGDESRLRHLAAGVQGAITAGARHIDITWSPCGRTHRFLPGQLEPQLAQGPGRQNMQHPFSIHIKRRLGLDLVRRKLQSAPLAEVLAITQNCGLCPLPLTVNGHPVERPRDLPQAFVHRPELTPGLGIVLEHRPLEIPALADMNVTVLGDIADDVPGRVTFVVGGVTIPQRSFPSMPGLAALVFFESALLNLSQSDLVEEDTYGAVLEGLTAVYARALGMLLGGDASDPGWHFAAQAGIASLLALLSHPRSGAQQQTLDELEHALLFAVDSPREGEPEYVSLQQIRQAERVFCLGEYLDCSALTDELRYPSVVRLRYRFERLPVLLEACARPWDDGEGLRRAMLGLPNLLIESERRRSVLAYFESGRRQGGIRFTTEKAAALEIAEDGSALTGPDWGGAVLRIQAARVQRLDIQEVTLPGQSHSCFYVLVSDGQQTLIYHQIYEEAATIPQSMRRTNQRAQSALHAIPGLLGLQARKV